MVRINPANKPSGSGWTKGFVKGFLISRNKDRAWVQPENHKHGEWIELRYLHKWQAWMGDKQMPNFGEPLGNKLKNALDRKPVVGQDYGFIRKYTPAQREEACNLRRMGKPIDDIATIMNLSRSTINWFLRQGGMVEQRPRKPKPEAVVQAAPTVPEPVAPPPPPVAMAPIPAPVPVLTNHVDIRNAIKEVMKLRISDADKNLIIDLIVDAKPV